MSVIMSGGNKEKNMSMQSDKYVPSSNQWMTSGEVYSSDEVLITNQGFQGAFSCNSTVQSSKLQTRRALVDHDSKITSFLLDNSFIATSTFSRETNEVKQTAVAKGHQLQSEMDVDIEPSSNNERGDFLWPHQSSLGWLSGDDMMGSADSWSDDTHQLSGYNPLEAVAMIAGTTDFPSQMSFLGGPSEAVNVLNDNAKLMFVDHVISHNGMDMRKDCANDLGNIREGPGVKPVDTNPWYDPSISSSFCGSNDKFSSKSGISQTSMGMLACNKADQSGDHNNPRIFNFPVHDKTLELPEATLCDKLAFDKLSSQVTNQVSCSEVPICYINRQYDLEGDGQDEKLSRPSQFLTSSWEESLLNQTHMQTIESFISDVICDPPGHDMFNKSVSHLHGKQANVCVQIDNDVEIQNNNKNSVDGASAHQSLPAPISSTACRKPALIPIACPDPATSGVPVYSSTYSLHPTEDNIHLAGCSKQVIALEGESMPQSSATTCISLQPHVTIKTKVQKLDLSEQLLDSLPHKISPDLSQTATSSSKRSGSPPTSKMDGSQRKRSRIDLCELNVSTFSSENITCTPQDLVNGNISDVSKGSDLDTRAENSSEDLKNIFEPLKMICGTASRVPRQTGLGISSKVPFLSDGKTRQHVHEGNAQSFSMRQSSDSIGANVGPCVSLHMTLPSCDANGSYKGNELFSAHQGRKSTKYTREKYHLKDNLNKNAMVEHRKSKPQLVRFGQCTSTVNRQSTSCPQQIAREDGLRSKKHKPITELQPWHHEVTLSCWRMLSISTAELKWASSVNRKFETLEDEVQISAGGVSEHRPRRRLALTTQLMQQLLPSLPYVILRKDSALTYSMVVYLVSKAILSDACGMVGYSGSNTSVHSYSANVRMEELRISLNIRDYFLQVIEDLFGRSWNVESKFLRLVKGTSIREMQLEYRDLERLSIVSCLGKFHPPHPEVAAECSSASSSACPITYPREHVTRLPLVGILPEKVKYVKL